MRHSVSPRTSLCKVHPDFHIPGDVIVGADFHAREYVGRLKECGVETVAFFAKCCYGHAYYDTKIGTRHPGLQLDMLRAMVEATEECGLELAVYYSTFLDTAIWEKHPEWRRVGSDGLIEGTAEHFFRGLCVNSGYLEEFMIPQALEIVGNYRCSEFLMDTMTGFKACYCDNCRTAYGRKIPQQNAEGWSEYMRWYAGCFDRFFRRMTGALKKAAPAVEVTHNWMWCRTGPEPAGERADRLVADDRALPAVTETHVRYWAGTGMPWDYMTGRFLGSLAEWNSTTPETLQLQAAISCANGGGYWIIDRQSHTGQFPEEGFRMAASTFLPVQARREALVGARHAPEIAVLHAFSTLLGKDQKYFSDPQARRYARARPYEGLCRMFQENSRHFTAFNEPEFVENLADHPVAIVPEQEFLAPETITALRSWVEAGGRLLITQAATAQAASGKKQPPTDEVDVGEGLLDLAGVRFEDWTDDLRFFYIDSPLGATGFFEEPVHVSAVAAKTKPGDGAKVLQWLRAPLPTASGAFGHGMAPADRQLPNPAMTSCRIGRGEVVYISFPLFTAYLDNQHFRLARLVDFALDRLRPHPFVRVTHPAQIELVVNRQGDDMIFHLINLSGRERLLTYYWPVIEFMPELRDIQVALRAPDHGGEVRVVSVPEGASLLLRPEGDVLTLTVPNLHVWSTFRVPGYFANPAPREA